MRARLLLGAAAGATLAAALWWRKNPSACPYGQRFWVEAPHPFISRDRLRAVLRPEPGERLLEIGVGTGYYSLDLAEWTGSEGTHELFDLEPKFLDHVMRAAGERGLTNLVPTQGAAPPSPMRTPRSTRSSSPPSWGRSPTPPPRSERSAASSNPAAAWSSASSSATPTSRLWPASSARAPKRASPTRSTPARGWATSRDSARSKFRQCPASTSKSISLA